jgi:hypothetical protein
LLADGWLLKRLTPATLLNPVTRRRRVAYGISLPRPRTRLASIRTEDDVSVFEDIPLDADTGIGVRTAPRRQRRSPREPRKTSRNRLREPANLATVGSVLRSPTDPKPQPSDRKADEEEDK